MSAEIIDLILRYNYLIIYPLSFVEGPTTTIVAGFLVSLGYLNPLAVFVVVFLADLTGDFVSYSIGRKISAEGGSSFWENKKSFLGVTKERLIMARKFIRENDIQTIYFGKFVPGFSIPILVSMGMSKLNLKRYTLIIGSAGAVKTLILVGIGVLFGNAFNVLKHYLDIVSSLLVILGLLVVLYVFIVVFMKGKFVD